MNGLFNMNFLMTFLLANNAIPQADTKNKFAMALAGGQSKNLMGPVLLKISAIDTIASLTEENVKLKGELAACQAKLISDEHVSDQVSTSLQSLLTKVRGKKTVQELKDDEGLLNEIHKLSGKTNLVK